MSKIKEKDEKIKSGEDKFVIEDAFSRLEEINKLLENPDTSLTESLSLYAEGVKLVNACKENLEGVEKEIQVLNEE
ncbi:MAG: exodeoxyribonuclease VII small subunit [Lachnospiraceae bacterium]|nr:exodeoxyribonuclease VII small subunit [Lachnospiraceae bacterium]MBQ9232772.1 exodeoxyribonuclease VII small subunit [Lachnospiraceae bacterium]